MRRLRIIDREYQPGHRRIELGFLGVIGAGERRSIENLTTAQAIAHGLVIPPAPPTGPEIVITSPTALTSKATDDGLTLLVDVTPPPGDSVETVQWFIDDPARLRPLSGASVDTYVPLSARPPSMEVAVRVALASDPGTWYERTVLITIADVYPLEYTDIAVPLNWRYLPEALPFITADLGPISTADWAVCGSVYDLDNVVHPFVARQRPATTDIWDTFPLPDSVGGYELVQDGLTISADGSSLVMLKEAAPNKQSTTGVGRRLERYAFNGTSWEVVWSDNVGAPVGGTGLTSIVASEDLSYLVGLEWNGGASANIVHLFRWTGSAYVYACALTNWLSLDRNAVKFRQDPITPGNTLIFIGGMIWYGDYRINVFSGSVATWTNVSSIVPGFDFGTFTVSPDGQTVAVKKYAGPSDQGLAIFNNDPAVGYTDWRNTHYLPVNTYQLTSNNLFISRDNRIIMGRAQAYNLIDDNHYGYVEWMPLEDRADLTDVVAEISLIEIPEGDTRPLLSFPNGIGHELVVDSLLPGDTCQIVGSYSEGYSNFADSIYVVESVNPATQQVQLVGSINPWAEPATYGTATFTRKAARIPGTTSVVDQSPIRTSANENGFGTMVTGSGDKLLASVKGKDGQSGILVVPI